jgi:4-amino-4-deoxy-L-arabinose transferase-like glycosyltransferase
MTTPPATRRSLRFSLNIEHWALIILLLLAFLFRTYELTDLGLGLEHDEVAEWQIANNIRQGENALFFKEAYGQEPLFLYLMAGSTALIGDNAFAIRFTSVFIAMLTLAASYRLLRRMFSSTVALLALAEMSIALWPVFWGRVGLRAMMLPLMLALGFDFLWRGLTKDEGRSMKDENRGPSSLRLSIPPPLRPFIIAGVFLGLSAYTYLSSRALPILLAIFTVYLALFVRKKMRGKWRGLFACFIIAVFMALPLVVTLLTQPDLQFRVSEVSAPLDKAVHGDTTEVALNIGRAFGMFTTQGDSTVRDNWPNRPVFPEIIGQWLFLGGVIVAFTRLRQPRYVLALLWIGVMLIPTIVTTGAPNFTRTLGALPMVFAMPGIAVEALLFWTPRLFPLRMYTKVSQVTNVLIVAGLIIVLGVNAVSTYADYFVKWPQHSETQFVFQADFAAIAKDIDASDVMDVSVGGLSNDTMDDPSLYLLRNRKDVRVRWFDSGSPISSGGAYLEPGKFVDIPCGWMYLPAIVPVSPGLEKYAITLNEGNILRDSSFQRYKLSGCGPLPKNALQAGGRFFEGLGILWPAYERIPKRIQAGQEFSFPIQWIASHTSAAPWRVFIHMVDPSSGRIIAQHDGLDSPPRFWQEGDGILQIHTLIVPPDTPPGRYEIWLGVYDPTTNKRLLQTDYSRSEPPSDHFVLGTIEVTP